MTTPFGQIPANAPLNDVFSAYDGVGGTAIAAAVTVPLTAEHIVSSATYTLSGNQVTIHESDDYELTYGVSFIVPSGNVRAQAQAWIERDSVELAGTRIMLYCRLNQCGASGSVQIYLPLVQDDVIRIRAQRTVSSGAVQCVANGSRLALRRL